MSDVKIAFSAETNAAALAIQNFTRNVESQLQHFGAAILAAFSVHAVLEFTKRMAESADHAGKTAEKVGPVGQELSAEAQAIVTILRHTER